MRQEDRSCLAGNSADVIFAEEGLQTAVLATLDGAELEPTPLDAVINALGHAAEERIAGQRDLARARQGRSRRQQSSRDETS